MILFELTLRDLEGSLVISVVGNLILPLIPSISRAHVDNYQHEIVSASKFQCFGIENARGCDLLENGSRMLCSCILCIVASISLCVSEEKRHRTHVYQDDRINKPTTVSIVPPSQLGWTCVAADCVVAGLDCPGVVFVGGMFVFLVVVDDALVAFSIVHLVGSQPMPGHA